jgi:catechol 2,3-dioxygenase-like lactoylglutathione lyase family enzyme
MRTLDHVALAVTDPARSLAFYRDLLGIEGDVRTEEYGFVIQTPNGISFTLFRGRPPSVPGDAHVGMSLADADEARAERERLLAAGATEVEWSEEPGYVSVKVGDPDGYIVELAWDEHWRHT